jgi:hypothetical protein
VVLGFELNDSRKKNMTDTIRRNVSTELMLHPPPGAVGALLRPESDTPASRWWRYLTPEFLLAGCACFLLGFLVGVAGVAGWDVFSGGLR